MSLPMLLSWEREQLRSLGETSRADGRRVNRVAIELDDGLALYVEIDSTTAEILRSAGVMAMGGAEMSFGTTYGPIVDFGQLRSSAREDQTAMGRRTGWTEIVNIELDHPPSRDTLQP